MPVSVFRVALLQIAPSGADPGQNRVRGESFCRKARELGADNRLGQLQ